MAKRQRASVGAAPSLDTDPPLHAGAIPSDRGGADAGERASFITFRVGHEAFGVRLEDVGEIIRMPALAYNAEADARSWEAMRAHWFELFGKP